MSVAAPSVAQPARALPEHGWPVMATPEPVRAATPQPVRFVAPEPEPEPDPVPEPERLRMATREDAKIGMITTDLFDVPLDWIDGEGNTRAQNLEWGINEADGTFYLPPSETVAEAQANGHAEDFAPDPAPASLVERFTPATHDIPEDWVNEYGFTLEVQNEIGREDDLEYWPPDRAPRAGLAH